MLTLHHLDDSRSQRILWLLEELGLEYEIVTHRRDAKTHLAPKALRELHPLGKAPLLVDEGRVLAESGHIIEHLLDEHDEEHALRPPRGSEAYERYRYWLHYAEGSAMLPGVLSVIFNELSRQSPWVARPLMSSVSSIVHKSYILGELRRHVSHWEAHLEAHRWFAGEALSGADMQMIFPLEGLLVEHPDLARDRPAVREYVERVHAREAYRRALERGGPYRYAPARSR